jgi:hypothetical protein
MDEPLGRGNGILPDEGRRNSKDYCPSFAKVPGYREYREQALRGMAAGDPLRDKDLPERTILIDKKRCVMNLLGCLNLLGCHQGLYFFTNLRY